MFEQNVVFTIQNRGRFFFFPNLTILRRKARELIPDGKRASTIWWQDLQILLEFHQSKEDLGVDENIFCQFSDSHENRRKGVSVYCHFKYPIIIEPKLDSEFMTFFFSGKIIKNLTGERKKKELVHCCSRRFPHSNPVSKQQTHVV